jgi:hypothetical protein
MVDEELIGQRRYFSSTGTAPATCERCGLPLAASEPGALTDADPYGDPDTLPRICPNCLRLIAQGLEPVELAGEE